MRNEKRLNQAEAKAILSSGNGWRSSWRVVENYLRIKRQAFTCESLAWDLRISTSTASLLIQNFLREQRRPNSRSRVFIHRRGKGRHTVWYVGHRRTNFQQVGEQLHSDVVTRCTRAYEPDLLKLEQLNPALAGQVKAKISSVLLGALVVLEHAVNGAHESS